LPAIIVNESDWQYVGVYLVTVLVLPTPMIILPQKVSKTQKTSDS
jgi:hypothetical protein